MSYRGMILGCVVLLTAITVAALWVVPKVAASQELAARGRAAATTRQAIKQTPILERPSRPGHFYGNTVRRRQNRHTG